MYVAVMEDQGLIKLSWKEYSGEEDKNHIIIKNMNEFLKVYREIDDWLTSENNKYDIFTPLHKNSKIHRAIQKIAEKHLEAVR